MKIKVNVKYPNDIKEVQEKSAEILSDILVKKLNTKEIKMVIKLLEDEEKVIKL